MNGTAKEHRRPVKVCLISLGCPKNLIDSEVMAGAIAAEEMTIVRDPAGADVAVVNTCGFIREAVEESLGAVEDLCRLKEKGLLKGVVAAGCLVERFRERLLEEIPCADVLIPISDYSRLGRAIRAAASGQGGGKYRPRAFGGRRRSPATDLSRVLLTSPHTAYLRIAEGCNHRCSFCAIPAIRGRLRSRPLPVILDEARRLAGAGVKEVNIVAEDTTDYGRDLGPGTPRLPELLDALGTVPGIRWIRVLYAFPSRVTDKLIERIGRNPKVLEYLDVPIQHYDGRILRAMRRGTSPEFLDRLVERLRGGVPGIVLRTSVIVGYPGETEAAFERLLGFLERVRFERLGAFAFSPEPGTAAYRMEDPLPDEIVADRIARVMAFQEKVIAERNISLVGRKGEVIVDRVFEKEARGRSRADAPDIDCGVVIRKGKVEEGRIVTVRFTGRERFDLIGEPVSGGRSERH